MEKPSSIRKDQALKPAQDFTSLKNKGIHYVQEFSGTIWTDYNAHDPGVTILEQFCYGLTELSYKASFPISDLLVERAEGRIDWKKNSFYSPGLVFSSHPVTAADFRKLVIDRFPEIQNCWLTPVVPVQGEEGINGVYQIELLPALPFQKRLRKYPEVRTSFLDKLKNFLHQNRNLAEDFDPPVLLQPLTISLKANVEVDQNSDIDRVMAEILFALEVYLYHPVAFSSLEELMEKGERLEDIFTGPRLQRGFILDEELKGRNQVLYTEKILNLISKLTGVKKCWNLGFSTLGNDKELSIPAANYAAINTDINDPDSVFSTLSLFVNGNLQRMNKSRVLDILLDLWSKNYRVYQVDLFKETFWESNLNGRFRNPANYESIQHHFPGIYGLGKDGLSGHEPVDRQAKVRQLKGYLMLLEKHLANFLAQLSHTADFFDSQNHQQEGSYYSQDFETRIDQDELEIKSMLDPGFNPQGFNPQTGESRLTWLERKNRVLDHLMARFGEEISDVPFQLSLKLNLLSSQEELLARMLQQKSKFLSLIADLNYVKNQAVFHFSDEEKPRFVLCKLLSLVMGFSPGESSLLPSFVKAENRNEKITPTSGLVKSKTSYPDFLQKFRPLSKEEKIFPLSDSRNPTSFSMGKIGIKDLFSRTLNPECYWISKTGESSKTVEVLFQKSESSWVSVWEGKENEAAVRAIADNIAFFRNENAKSEGMYLVDHILLRKILEGTEFGFELRDEWGKPTFRSTWVADQNQRNRLLTSFYQASLHKEAYVRGKNEILIEGEEGEILGVFQDQGKANLEQVIESTSTLALLMAGEGAISGRLALAEIEKLRLKGTLHEQGVYRQRSVVFLRKRKDGKLLSEDFFNLKTSLILPDWPARFQEKHFRHFLEAQVKERVPAQVNLQIHWLNLEEFKAFEQVHTQWANQNQAGRSEKGTTSGALALYDFLVAQMEGGLHG
ncbi:hypothetical protein [Algoriphagus sp.]|uniref:hypothetical protein n=1 Tax=Algoriphagus sp. TaxID=1872435 RepID=UPI00260BB27D|nr:hypothetical protein [Algoriphagus sp.]